MKPDSWAALALRLMIAGSAIVTLVLVTLVFSAVVHAQVVVWVDDAVPPGSTPQTLNDSWTWVSTDPTPYAGALAHKSDSYPGLHQHYFTDVVSPPTIPVGGAISTWVYLDPMDSPREIMMQFRRNDVCCVRAYWGENLIDWGAEGSEERVYMGPLPTAGQWTELRIPAVDLGLEGQWINAMTFTLYDGVVTWDYTTIEEPPIVYEAPVFDSAELIGSDYVLNWSPPAAGEVPVGGYDVVVDNVDTNLPQAVVYTYNVTGLNTLIEHCFRVQSRHTQAPPSGVFPESNEICVPPVPSQTVPYDITNLSVIVIP